MARKKLTKTPKEGDYEQSLRLAKQLIKILKDKEDWTKQDDNRLKKLEKMVSLLNKMKALEDTVTKVANSNDKTDDEIIERFLKRKKVINEKAH